MPDEKTNQDVITLDNALGSIQRPKFCTEAYRRVGNELREFLLYMTDQDEFLHSLNVVLADQPQFPIAITFYEDTS